MDHLSYRTPIEIIYFIENFLTRLLFGDDIFPNEYLLGIPKTDINTSQM